MSENKKRILVVDDDPQVARLLHDIFENEFSVTTAADGSIGLEKLRAEKFDLLLCDVWMPNVNGIEVLKQLKNMPNHPPAIMMTADDTPQVLLQAVKGEAQQLVGKPFKTADMLELVRKTLSTPPVLPIDVVSAKAEWVELLVPCEIQSANRAYDLMLKLKADLPEEVRESVGQAFRELLLNAVEWGGKLDATRQVRISFLRAKRMLIYRIADPGSGFRFEGLSHAAINNPPDDPIGHMKVRDEKGLRPGGLGLMITQSLVDELIYNEAQNEVVFVKYLD